ncbi:hypothetical protein FPOAC2_04703 [Fusarium poae]|uniref:hypothetical protein n=1 Tax=Fusarium poae TaxID=36050 RepID=UPI001CEBBA82|nr:hypothetical protein FPOAC1_004614 [Fusarium poae]KAG8671367.1 hypothetical protein FPOAC1_004614 [Fusarium poae]
MRPPKISLITILSVFLLFSCLLGSAAGSSRQQRQGRHRVLRSDRFMEARQPSDDYGPPPQYYTGEPAIPSEMTSYSTSKETTTTDIGTESSEASMTSQSHASPGNHTISRGISTPSLSTELDTSSAVPSVASSAKAGSTTSSEALTSASTTASGSSRVTGTSGDEASATAGGQMSSFWNNSTSLIRTSPSEVTNRDSDSISTAGTASWETELSSTGILPVTVSSLLTLTETTTEVISLTDTALSLEVSGNTNMTARTSSTAEAESLSVVFASTSLEESSLMTAFTTTTTRILNTTVTVTDGVESTGRTLSSTTYLTPINGSSSAATSVGFVSDVSSQTTTRGLTTIGISGPESTQKTSLVTSAPLNRTVIVTTTTYLTSTLETATLSTDFSNQSGSSSTPNGSLVGSGSDITTVTIQTSSDISVASSALPVNATSSAVANSLTTTTVSETSFITIVPGGVSPSGSITSMTSGSVSASTSSLFNSSMTRMETPSSQETSLLFDWPTSTLVESHHSMPTLGLPPVSFTSFSFSIVTTPMTPPSVVTGSTSPSFENVTVIRSTWTSTITTSLGPTGLTSANLTAAHTSSGYNFSKTIESEMSSVGSLSTSANNLTDISTSIITRQPTNLPFPSNTSSGWNSTVSSTLLTGSTKTINSQGPQTSLSTAGSGLNATAPYANSTSTTNSATYSPPFGNVTSSRLAVTTYRSWNATNTAQGPFNSTVQTATNGLNGTATVTPFPTTDHVTLTTISGSVLTKTYTDILVSIITPTDPAFWTSLNTTGWTMRTITSTPGMFSTPYKESTSTSEQKYHTSNATRPFVSASGTNAPLFPSSNSTATATITFSSIVSWTPDPEPWTTWSTWDLTRKPGFVTSIGLPRVTTRNLSSEASESTLYTRTTTLFVTPTMAEPTESRVVTGNLSSKASGSTSYSRTTTVVLTTTLAEPSTSLSKLQNSTDDASSSISYTSTTTLLLTTTLGEPSTSRLSNAAITSTASIWMNTTLVSVQSSETSTSLSEVSATFLTTGSAKGIATSAENSALTPFPVMNSTLSQVTSLAIDTMTTTHTSDRPAGAATPCESSSTTSSTCTESLDYSPYGSSSAGSPTTDCSTGHSTASYKTAHWSNMTETFGAKGTSTNESLTTFKTVTTVRAEESHSVWDDYPTPTDRVIPSEVVPADPNFPWGNDSPIHRHQNMSDVGIGLDGGGVSKRIDWRLRWENVKDKINSLWHGQTLESED